MGAPSGGEVLSNEVIETDDGSFAPLARTVAMLLADGVQDSGEGREEGKCLVFTHRHFFSRLVI